VTQNQERVAAIVSIVAPQLKRAGFRKRRNSFNREVADGIVHVVSLQLGSYDPSGKFTINLGVFVPGLNQVSSGSRGPWVTNMTATFGGGSGNSITRDATSGGASMTKQGSKSRPTFC
jgi:hypothetical protein